MSLHGSHPALISLWEPDGYSCFKASLPQADPEFILEFRERGFWVGMRLALGEGQRREQQLREMQSPLEAEGSHTMCLWP